MQHPKFAAAYTSPFRGVPNVANAKSAGSGPSRPQTPVRVKPLADTDLDLHINGLHATTTTSDKVTISGLIVETDVQRPTFSQRRRAFGLR